jgi:hypothetical protein
MVFRGGHMHERAKKEESRKQRQLRKARAVSSQTLFFD